MTGSASELIRNEIRRHGPIPFVRFMELALFAPNVGYYTRRDRDPFGASGDFFTAEQVQPVFGDLISKLVRRQLKGIDSRTVVELGPGRGEMARAFEGLDYRPIESGDKVSGPFSGVVFANEFFDAHPVHLMKRGRAGWREQLVTVRDNHFVWARTGRPASVDVQAYLDRYHARPDAGDVVEVNLQAREWVASVTAAVERGYFVIVDYGYTAPEYLRHSRGTLIGYSHHQAGDDILVAPGDRDITAHVAWTSLEDALVDCGWKIEQFATLAKVILDVGTEDQFASLFAECGAIEEMRRRLQLKTLLFGMGETFRVMIASRIPV